MARVIVADDNLLARTLLRQILERAGHEVVGEAENGESVIGLAADERPDLVLLDICMPRRDGLSALRHLLLREPSLRVVMCSASATESRVVEALRLGARDFIVKPIETSRVLAAVERALGTSLAVAA